MDIDTPIPQTSQNPVVINESPLPPSQSKKKYLLLIVPFVIIAAVLIVAFGMTNRVATSKKVSHKASLNEKTISPTKAESIKIDPQWIHKEQVPIVHRLIFKSDTEEYLSYKFVEYSIPTRRIIDLPSETKLPITSRLSISHNLKQCLLVTEETVSVCSTDKPQELKTIFTAQWTKLREERINYLNTQWSQDGSRIVIEVDSYTQSVDHAITLYTVNPDGSDLKRFKTITTSKLYLITAYDSGNDLLYTYYSDPKLFVKDSEILDTKSGEVKGKAALLDDNKTRDITYSSDMRYAFYQRWHQNELSLLQYDMEAKKERVLFSSKEGGLILLSIPSYSAIIVKKNLQGVGEVTLHEFATGKDELLYNLSDIPYVPESFSPDGNYIFTENNTDYDHPLYAVYDVKAHTMTKITPSMLVKLSAMERVNWLP